MKIESIKKIQAHTKKFDFDAFWLSKISLKSNKLTINHIFFLQLLCNSSEYEFEASRLSLGLGPFRMIFEQLFVLRSIVGAPVVIFLYLKAKLQRPKSMRIDIIDALSYHQI